MKLPNINYLESDAFPFHLEWHQLEAGTRVPVHSHEFIELVYVAQGSGVHVYNGRPSRVSKGDVFIISEDAEHGYELGDGESLLVCNLLFIRSLLSSELQAMSSVTPFVNFFYVEPFLRESEAFQPNLTLPPNNVVEMEMLLNRIGQEYTEKPMGYRNYIKALLMELFLFLGRCNLANSVNFLSMRDEDETLRQVCDFIRAHCNRNIGLKPISQMCGFSETKFSRAFKRHTGMTYIQYRNHYRIELAKDMLTRTNEKILSVALQAGFDDLSMFNRTFKRLMGLTPKQFRERAKSQEGVKYAYSIKN